MRGNAERPGPERHSGTMSAVALQRALGCCFLSRFSLSAILTLTSLFMSGCAQQDSCGPAEQIKHLDALTALPPHSLGVLPVTRLNALCAQGLGIGPVKPDSEECQRTLRTWVGRVRSETDRHLYRFRQKPAEYEHSEGFFRMLMLSVVLAEDFNVHYDPQRKDSPAQTRPEDTFFGDPEAVFIHGLLGPDRRGTCSSLPVLYVAVGRELGYPLKLVTTKGHLFVRWEGAGERFNIEATSHGLNRFDDEYYRHWPFEVSAAEEKAEGYLKSLSPPEELAVFLSIRGMCLRHQGRISEAAEAFQTAARLAPNCTSYRAMAVELQRRSAARHASTRLTNTKL